MNEVKQFFKRLVFGTGVRQKKILFGLARGIRMHINMEHKIQRLVGLDELEIQNHFKKFALTSSAFIDIGASDGYYGLIYYKLNSHGEQFLCEANPAFLSEQKGNFAANGYLINRVHFITKFISDVSNENSLRLDQALADCSEKNVLVKIDVDGGEVDVLKGMRSALLDRNCKIIIETHSKELEEACISYLQQLNFKTLIVPNAWWRFFIPELRQFKHNRWFVAEKKA